ncbi:fasciclin domain-containing protein [Fibrella forsythiae]|uniref:Fasciclin domain-containing protein n=1 Tax=Fibrella forsythiae TaxID=2817061 RepID=A0ABS3JAT1_9BACT|nr:fasciclin domain-containing protein [Fibrella forsythiae]MBO0947097.1 fasciclin domain-containing protein [Fibrella forsythiae]
MSTLFSSCKHVDTPVAVTHTITDILVVNNSFTFLRAAVQRAGMTDMLRTGTYTVFAPTDDAFRAAGYADVAAINQLPVAAVTALVQYHVIDKSVPASAIQGGQTVGLQTLLPANGMVYISKVNNYLSANGHLVTTSDVAADNGVMHVVSAVLSPPNADAISTILSDPQNFSLLAAAVQRAGAGLLTVLQSTTAATIFAPTNEAFIASGYTPSAIAGANPAALQRLLNYHLLPGRYFSNQFINGQTPKTVLGSTIRMNVSGSSVSITALGDTTTAATVVRPDILSTNAVIHRIDRVLIPPP